MRWRWKHQLPSPSLQSTSLSSLRCTPVLLDCGTPDRHFQLLQTWRCLPVISLLYLRHIDVVRSILYMVCLQVSSAFLPGGTVRTPGAGVKACVQCNATRTPQWRDKYLLRFNCTRGCSFWEARAYALTDPDIQFWSLPDLWPYNRYSCLPQLY